MKGLEINTNSLNCFLVNDKKVQLVNKHLESSGITLTKREAECFYLLAQGITSKKIAKVLDLSPRTVEEYIIKIKNKIGVSYKWELSMKAMHLILETYGQDF